MQKMFTEKEFDSARRKDKLPLKCVECSRVFLSKKKHIIEATQSSRLATCEFCSISCQRKFQNPLIKANCSNCNKPIQVALSQFSRSVNHFCSQSCSATYNNKHKTKGTRRSKLEKWLEEMLTKKYLKVNFEFNKKNAIGSELDIYIPSLRLAFELNGIYHYEPIHGYKKLGSIQNNDQNKFQACILNKINLCVIDTSKLSYFKETNAKKYLDIISTIINSAIEQSIAGGN